MVISSNERIYLASPLPWTSESGCAGFLIEMSESELIVESDSLDSNHGQIEIRLTAQQSYRLNPAGFTKLKDGHYRLSVSGHKDLEQTKDLLGQIRKIQHILLCQNGDIEASDRYTGFSELSFLPEALADLDFDSLDTGSSLLGRRFDYPILITGMTGGVDLGTTINERLAAAAAKWNIPMGVGSQRIALDNPEYAPIFSVKKFQPSLFLIGNLGIAQLHTQDYLDRCKRAVDMIEADALAIHVNILQELIQVEGDRHFKGLGAKLETLSETLEVPVIVKEVGAGMSAQTALKLSNYGVKAIDIGGKGGTSWAYIEGMRSAQKSMTRELGEEFRDWGMPTAYSLHETRQVLGNTQIIATGGIRDGLTVAKACALGADMVGVGLPLLRAALESENGPTECIERFTKGLKIAMLASGAASLSDLKQKLVFNRHPGLGWHERI